MQNWLSALLITFFFCQGVFADEAESNDAVFRIANLTVEPSFLVKGHFEVVDGFPVHSDGADYAPRQDGYNQVRLGLNAQYDIGKFHYVKAKYEQDLISRSVYDDSANDDSSFEFIDGDLPKGPALRELNLEYRYKAVSIASGRMISNWGLGLLANGGRTDWQPGSAYFGSPYGGDRVNRNRVIIGPIPQLQRLALVLAYDNVVDDDILVEDDEARQFITALVLRPGEPNTVGVYAAFRTQDHADGKTTDARAFDFFGQYEVKLDPRTTLKTALEFALITGETELAPNPTFEKHDLLQAGALWRTSLSKGNYGFINDVLYASGDQNTDDDQINQFRVDPNLESGLILYRHVLTGVSGHMSTAASDPDLVGYPAQDLERLATNRTISNTVALFPKVWWRFAPEIEVYGGALFAFSEVSLIDPKNARLAGGENRNAFNAAPGGYLGTEYDVGLRFFPKMGPVDMNIGFEYARFVFGDAFTDQTGAAPSSINASRIYVRSAL